VFNLKFQRVLERERERERKRKRERDVHHSISRISHPTQPVDGSPTDGPIKGGN